MAEHPILFNSEIEMVRAILDGRKTQTRRVIKPPPTQISNECPLIQKKGHKLIAVQKQNCPYGVVGDKLWVKEDYKYLIQGDMVIVYYKYSINKNLVEYTPLNCLDKKTQKNLFKSRQHIWKSKLLMFKFMARIYLEITNIRVERVQDIGESGAEVEGVEHYETAGLKGWKPYGYFVPNPTIHQRAMQASTVSTTARESFASLWNLINAKRGYGWKVNPWVWVIEFKVEKRVLAGKAKDE